MKKHTTFDGPRSLRQIGRITAVLARVKQEKAPPLSIADLAEELCVHADTVRVYMVHLVGLKENRTVRIAGWDLNGKRYTALYALGSRNVPCPKRKTKAERHRAMMADPVAHAKDNAYRRKWRRARSGRPPLQALPAPWFAGLPGA